MCQTCVSLRIAFTTLCICFSAHDMRSVRSPFTICVFLLINASRLCRDDKKLRIRHCFVRICFVSYNARSPYNQNGRHNRAADLICWQNHIFRDVKCAACVLWKCYLNYSFLTANAIVKMVAEEHIYGRLGGSSFYCIYPKVCLGKMPKSRIARWDYDYVCSQLNQRMHIYHGRNNMKNVSS